MERIDIAIIGGGVIGLAVAASMAQEDRNIFIFEKNMSFGQETSSRNSEVIHSGIYYPEHSVKTLTCIKGNRMLYEICSRNNILCNKTGKLIVARDGSELDALEELFVQGEKNGLEGLRMLNAREVNEFEDNITTSGAIYLPMTGIIDSHSLMEYFLEKAKSRGADIVYNSEIVSIEKIRDGYRLEVSGSGGDSYSFTAGIVINCAGLNSDTVSRLAGINNDEYTLHYCKGDYFRVGNKKNLLVKHLIYPVVKPDDTSLGIHVTPDLAGEIRLGPDAEYLDSRDTDYNVDPDKKEYFYESVKPFLPFLDRDDLSADTSGIRPKLQGPDDGFRDFVIRHEIGAGLEGFINLIGIESPGLTASPVIAEMVREMAKTLA